MPFPLGYMATLATAPAAGNAVAATTTQTSLLTGSAANAVCTLPGNWMDHLGLQFNVKASGVISTPSATQGNITFNMVFGGVTTNSTPTFTSLASQTNITWELELELTVRALGSGTAANMIMTGRFFSALVSATNLVNLVPATAPVVGSGFNSQGSNTVDLQCTWSNATAGNTITLYQYALTSRVNY